MQASCSDLLAKLQITHVPEDSEPQQIVEKRVGASANIETRSLAIEKTMTVVLCGKL